MQLLFIIVNDFMKKYSNVSKNTYGVYHFSDNYADLSDLYVVLSYLYVRNLCLLVTYLERFLVQLIPNR